MQDFINGIRALVYFFMFLVFIYTVLMMAVDSVGNKPQSPNMSQAERDALYERRLKEEARP